MEHNYPEKNNDIGPGSYQIDKENQKNKQNMMPQFKSQTTRSFWDKIYYQTQRDGEVQRLQQEGIKEDTTPGPTSYYVEKAKKGVLVKSKDPKFQFFNGTEERFMQIDRKYNVSPDQYNITKQTQVKYSELNGFLGSERTNLNLKHLQDNNPGVGQYNIVHINSMERKIIQNNNFGMHGNFGSTQKRKFSGNLTDNKTGPGDYNIAGDLTYKEFNKIPSHQVNFKSKTDRIAFSVPKDNQIQQDPKDVKILGVLKNKIHKTNQNMFQRSTSEKENFNTLEKRFPHYEHQQSPPRQKKQTDLEQMEAIQKRKLFEKKLQKIQKDLQQSEHPPFLISVERFPKDQFSTSPGVSPASYKNQLQSQQMIKQSHNVKYQQENRLDLRNLQQ